MSTNEKGPAPQPDRKTESKWTVLLIVSIGVFMATLDASIVNISLPKISSSFNVPLSGTVEWVIIGYLVVIASTLLTLGRLSDMFGRKTPWVAGLGTFTVSSALCGASPTLGFLIVARALQGVGGAVIMANSPALITQAFPGSERGRALGMLGGIVAIGTSAGPTLGGIITSNFSWHWISTLTYPSGLSALPQRSASLSGTG